MPRIQPLTHETASDAAKPLLDGVKKKMGIVPNLLATLAHSPAALNSYLSQSSSLGDASISAGVREQIALTIAGENSCGYCASAHTVIAKGAGVDDAEAASSLRGESSDPKIQAALTFAAAINEKRGWIDDADFQAVRNAGYTDGEILEILATVTLNIYTNYANHIASTANDFPAVELPTAQATS